MKKALGIDLGTTNSAMAIVKNGQPEIIPMGANDETVLRSALYFSNIAGKNRVFFGTDAIHRGTDLGRVEYFKQDFKRDIAKEDGSETPDKFQVNSVILSALILNQFKKRADIVAKELGIDSIHDAVITVPAYFTSEQRAATKNAGRLAGLNVLRIINEPTAAAISYAHEKGVEGNILVYDLGGGTFDVTVMEVTDHHYNILATDGNHRLGGLDFDNRLVMLIEKRLEEQGMDLSSLSPKEKIQLRYQAEKIKIALSLDQTTFYETFTEQGEFGFEITREDFYQAVFDLIKDTQIKVQNTMVAAGLTWEALDHVLLVGGSTRMPIVRQMIEEISHKKPRYEINPDTIVAEGASIIADLIVNDKVSFNESAGGETTNSDRVIVQDVTSQGIGMLLRKSPYQTYDFVGDFFNRVVVEKNTLIPAVKNHDIYAVADGQNNFRLRITEGNYANPMSVRPILEIIEHLPHSLKKGDKVAQIRFAFDTEQIIHIMVVDGQTNDILNRYQINANLKSQNVTVEDDLSELQAIYDNFVS